MKILTLEFASAQRSVAVFDAIAHSQTVSEVIESGQRGPLSMIDEALRQAGLEREQIECIAVGLGPGSYTGIRASIAMAQGWQLASKVKLLGIGSDEILAEQCRIERVFGPVNLLIDAQRNEFYLTKFVIDRDQVSRTEPLQLISADRAQSILQSGESIAGPDAGKLAGSRLLYPGAAVLAQLASQRKNFVSGEELIPLYLRPTAFVKTPLARALPS